MSPRHWLRFWRPTSSRPTAQRPKVRLGVESLEARETPAVGFGSAFAVDTGGGWLTDVAVDSAGNTYVNGSSGVVGVTKINVDGSVAWSRPLPGTNDLAVDADGNVVVAGRFSGTLNLDSISLTSQGHDDAFVIRLDSAGTAVWGRQLGGSVNDSASSVVVDAAGNAFVTGSISGDIFVANLAATSGNTIWLRQVGGSDNDSSRDIVLDNSGNVLVCGEFVGKVDFDPGPGNYTLTSGGRSVEPSVAAFVLKLNGAGNFVWAVPFQASQWSGSSADSIAVDAADNIYVSGTFDDTVDFDPGKKKLNLPHFGVSDGYVVKLNSAGSLVWARSFGGSNHDRVTDMTVDAAGNVYLAVEVMGTATFGSFTVGAGSAVARLDASGTFQWAVSVAGTRSEGIALNDSGNLTIVGIFFPGTVDFDPTEGVYELTAAERMSFLLTLTQS